MENRSKWTARLAEALLHTRVKLKNPPRVALVLGSGLGAFADEFSERVVIPYGGIPHMPQSSVVGHAGQLVAGRAGGLDVIAMQGRVHMYEGHSAEEVVFGLRLMLQLGANRVIVTNAAGGLHQDFSVGDLMLIEDHLNLTGRNSLLGPNDDQLGPRFVDMTVAYDKHLRGIAQQAARSLGFQLQRGVYAGLLGPTYETPAEIRMLRTLGADAVGMSTVLETIAARHMGARVLGISCITNMAAGMTDAVLNHEEVQETANRVKSRFSALLTKILEAMAAESSS